MTYATQTDYSNCFGEIELKQICDKDNTGTINKATFNIAALTADGLIDSFCGRRYVVPFATVTPDLILQIALDVTRYYLYDEDMNEIILARFKLAMDKLEDIASGRLLLDGAVLLPVPEGGFPSGAAISKGESVKYTAAELSKRP